MSSPKWDKEVFESFRRLAKEKGYPDYRLILEGDYSGQTYLIVPFCLVGPKARISTLLGELDQIAWACNDGDGNAAFLFSPSESAARFPNEAADPSIYDGDQLIDGLWLNEEFAGIKNHVRAMLNLSQV